MSTKSLQMSSLDELSARLDALSENVFIGNQSLSPFADASNLTLDKARQELLKLVQAEEAMRLEYVNQVAMDLLDPETALAVDQVALVRDQVGAEYARASQLASQLKSGSKATGNKVSLKIKAKLADLESQAKEIMGDLLKLMIRLPDLGMTFEEYDSLTQAQRRGLRPRGRPSPSIEMLLHINRYEQDALLQYVIHESNGKIRTLEQALDGVSLSNRGRPAISPLGKMDRQLSGLIKRYEKAQEEGASEAFLLRTSEKIKELRDQIQAEENLLEGAEVPKRELEKIRAHHRELAVAESEASGEEQVHLLLSILRNEEEQMDVIEEILNLDPNARVTVTHKVNPKDTRERFERLRKSGLLGRAQLAEVDRMEKKFNEFGHSRSRYANNK